jgi:nicotinate-nucleotide--dimethylbenzimidazole phosphoribosyltransferase
MDFSELNKSIPGPDATASMLAQAHWDGIAKPLGSLGLLETAIVTIAGVTGNPDVRLDKRAVIVLCADNGVVCEGISQSGCEVTRIVAENLTRRQTSVCRMAASVHTDVIPVDMGMAQRLDNPLLLDRHVADGTQNIAAGPAMTRAQAEAAICAGIELVRDCRDQGYQILATGEMGIGNTTTSSAIAAVLTGRPVPEVTGRGSGLSDEALTRKIRVIEKAIAVTSQTQTMPLTSS